MLSISEPLKSLKSLICSELAHFGYGKIFREYYIYAPSKGVIQGIQFCPWCGKQLSSGVRDDWFNILKQEYGLEDHRNKDEHLVSEEFKSDEWWKKRNL